MEIHNGRAVFLGVKVDHGSMGYGIGHEPEVSTTCYWQVEAGNAHRRQRELCNGGRRRRWCEMKEPWGVRYPVEIMPDGVNTGIIVKTLFG